MVRREVTDLTDQDIDTLSKDQLKEWTRRLDPNFKVSGGIAQLRVLVRRERDRVLELRDLRREPPAVAPGPSQQPAATPSNHQDVSNIPYNSGNIAIAGKDNGNGNLTNTEYAAPIARSDKSAKKSKIGTGTDDSASSDRMSDDCVDN